MTGSALAYFLFGLGLVVLLAWVMVHYYRRHRHETIEAPKHRMLDDDH